MKLCALALTLAAAGFGVAADPDPRMQAVLDAHKSLNPKPIKSLTPAVA